MKKKLLIILGTIFLLLFIVYNEGLDIGNVHLGKHTDRIEKERKFTINESKFYQEALTTDKLVIVNLWATWCKPCIEEMPMFIKLKTENPDVKLITMSIDRDNDKLQNYLAKHPEMPDVTMENASYRTAIRNFLESRNTDDVITGDIVPMTYFLKNGKVLKKIQGSVESAELISTIKSLR